MRYLCLFAKYFFKNIKNGNFDLKSFKTGKKIFVSTIFVVGPKYTCQPKIKFLGQKLNNTPLIF